MRIPAPVLVSIQVGQPQDLGDPAAENPMDRPWRTAFIKTPVPGPVFLGRTNIEGDEQADRVNHGGPDKAVCAYCADHYDHWRTALGLTSLAFGAFGENFTLGAVSEWDVCIGDTYAVGETVVQISQPRQPCWKMARRWRIKDMVLRVEREGRTGWYFRVLREGRVAPGERLTLIDRPSPEWTVAAANEVMHHQKHDAAAAETLAQVPALSAAWRNSLLKRVAKLSIA